MCILYVYVYVYVSASGSQTTLGPARLDERIYTPVHPPSHLTHPTNPPTPSTRPTHAPTHPPITTRRHLVLKLPSRFCYMLKP